MLTSIAGGGIEAFCTESETYRCTTGNQSLAFALAGAIGEPTIQLKAPVASIDLSGRSAKVGLQSGRVLEPDAVVLTAPPSTWQELGITPALPESYRMSTGSAIKVLCRVDRPFWTSANLEPESLSDQPVGMTWQGGEPATPAPKGPACLTVFAGGGRPPRPGWTATPRSAKTWPTTTWTGTSTAFPAKVSSRSSVVGRPNAGRAAATAPPLKERSPGCSPCLSGDGKTSCSSLGNRPALASMATWRVPSTVVPFSPAVWPANSSWWPSAEPRRRGGGATQRYTSSSG